MKHLLFFAVALTLTHNLHLRAVTILASQFNALYTCQNPFRPNESSTIILDENITVPFTPNGCRLIEAGPGFDLQTDTVTFNSTLYHALIIATSARWIVGVNTTFIGNAQLQLMPGSIIQFPDFRPTLRMDGNSLLISKES